MESEAKGCPGGEYVGFLPCPWTEGGEEAARAPAARQEAQRLQGEAEKALAEAEASSSRPGWRI
ncbi:MAG: hypothetical protein JW999_11585 [Methanotrichaceae archaeon]|nr:hypothetical protein [Methanotrichaceae archaeon]